MANPSDRKLWEQASSSDAAFGELFERHAKAVYNYCFRRVGKWDLAEDLMAATFLEAWRRRDEIQLAGESLRPWLLGTATNLMRNQRPSARRRDAALQRVRSETPRQLSEDDAADRLDDERAAALPRSTLTRPQRHSIEAPVPSHITGQCPPRHTEVGRKI